MQQIKVILLISEVTSNKSKHVLAKNEFKKLHAFDWSLFIDQIHFFNVGVQLYLIFQPLYYISKTLSNSEKVILWNSKGFSTEKLTTLFYTDKIFP